MKQTIVFLAFPAMAAALLAISGCDKKATPAAGAESKAAVKGGAKGLQVPAAQKQFLTVEEAGAAQGGELLALPGRVAFRPQAQFAMGAPMSGRVAAVLVRVGEIVKAGAPLLAIDSADAAAGRASLDQAATRLASAENMFKRQVEMVQKGVGLEIDRQEAEAKLQEARAEHDRARHAAGLVGSGAGEAIGMGRISFCEDAGLVVGCGESEGSGGMGGGGGSGGERGGREGQAERAEGRGAGQGERPTRDG